MLTLVGSLLVLGPHRLAQQNEIATATLFRKAIFLFGIVSLQTFNTEFCLFVQGPPMHCLTMSVSLPSSVDDGDAQGGLPSLPMGASCSSLGDVSMPSDEDVVLPDEVGDEADAPYSAFDEDDDFLSETDEAEQFGFLVDETHPVPSPWSACRLSTPHDLAEFYSPPRVVPVATRRGLRGNLSLDLLSGWDFKSPDLRDLSLRLLTVLTIYVLILSPPCTIFSELQRLWNFKKMTAETIKLKWDEGMLYLRHSMDCARAQYNSNRVFVFEHPFRASSWKTAEVMSIAALAGVETVNFDQCMLGLTSKVHKLPMRKRIKIMTNSKTIAARFSVCQCDRSHEHQTIQGSEGGVRRSVWAQCYPQAMVELLADSAATLS
jgi:hypothetical protein